MLLEDNPYWKAISVKKLRELLNELPDDYLLSPNDVHNIAILDAQEYYVGFIGIVEEEVDLIDAPS